LLAAAGYHMQRAPDFTASFNALYGFDLGGGRAELFRAADRPGWLREGGAVRAVDRPVRRFTYAVFGDNLTDKRYLTQALRRFSEVLRARKRRRRNVLRSAWAIGLLAFGLGATVALPPRPLLVWNASASAPVGLYAVSGATGVDVGDMVIARLPSEFRALAARRRYLPLAVPLVKRVAAVSGDRVCALGHRITINGEIVAWRRRFDGRGRPMPWWRGCTLLRGGAVLLLMDSPSSFDGRYFGPTLEGDIVGRAHLLWARR
jgi:conjugative transfer signal peptidase TraF